MFVLHIDSLPFSLYEAASVQVNLKIDMDWSVNKSTAASQ